jgi:hypothetical protein
MDGHIIDKTIKPEKNIYKLIHFVSGSLKLLNNSVQFTNQYRLIFQLASL